MAKLSKKTCGFLAAVLLFSGTAICADSEPHMKTKLCNPTETRCTDVEDDGGTNRLQASGKIVGNSDGTKIGNVTDRLKVIDQDVVNAITSLSIVSSNYPANIFRSNEAAVTSRNETDLATVTYTVTAGKLFALVAFSASYDSQAAMYVRLKKQTGGTGPFVTIMRVNMMTGGQGNSTVAIPIGRGIIIGQGGDVFKITYEASISKGTLQAQFAGLEY